MLLNFLNYNRISKRCVGIEPTCFNFHLTYICAELHFIQIKYTYIYVECGSLKTVYSTFKLDEIWANGGNMNYNQYFKFFYFYYFHPIFSQAGVAVTFVYCLWSLWRHLLSSTEFPNHPFHRYANFIEV